jgi:hypothetical protein
MSAGVWVVGDGWKHTVGARRIDRLGDAKVGDHRRASREEHIVRLDVAMYDPSVVRKRERTRHLAQHALYGQRFALHVWHREVRQPARVVGGDQRHDVRVLPLCGQWRRPRGRLRYRFCSRVASSGTHRFGSRRMSSGSVGVFIAPQLCRWRRTEPGRWWSWCGPARWRAIRGHVSVPQPSARVL